MTRAAATEEAKQLAKQNRIAMAIVDEGPAADDFAVRDTDDKSYGYCPEAAVPILYRNSTVVEIVKPRRRSA